MLAKRANLIGSAARRDEPLEMAWLDVSKPSRMAESWTVRVMGGDSRVTVLVVASIRLSRHAGLRVRPPRLSHCESAGARRTHTPTPRRLRDRSTAARLWSQNRSR